MLLALGGLVLAAGLMSVVRVGTPEYGDGGPGAGAAGRSPGAVAGSEPATDTVATVPAGTGDTRATNPPDSAAQGSPDMPHAHGTAPGTPSAPSAAARPQGNAPAPVPGRSTTVPHAPEAPQVPGVPSASATSGPTSPPPRPPTDGPAPSPTPSAPAPEPDRPGLCLPIVDLCLGLR
ncbi:hypothetical protein [Streptomyces sp. NPDC047706]|uniref:hypothetical protein n=1 Tax=Streptomyces sp. NPDC047706 TaxID=3365486 RepID=UPI00371BDEEF